MANRRGRIDGQGGFDWESRVDEYVERKTEIIEACSERPRTAELGLDEACVEIAVAIKRGLRRSGLSREQLCDRINEYFGLSEGEGERKPLSVHMLNHYLSKPSEYPAPAYLLIPIVNILESFEPVQAIAEPAGGRVISESEVKLMSLGKLETTIAEMQRLKRELKSR